MKYNTPVADEVRVHEISRAVCTIDTVNGQPLVDLIVEAEDKQAPRQHPLDPESTSTPGPCWSLRLMAVPSSVEPAVFLGSAATRHATQPFDGTTRPRGGGVSAPTAWMMCLVEQPPPP